MAKTVFGSGTIVTSTFLNGAQKIYFDGLNEDWHFDPIGIQEVNAADTGNGLGTKFLTLDTRQTILEPKVFHNSPNTTPGPLPDGTTSDQYRFTERVIGQDPTAQKHLATKDYVDRMIEAINIPNVSYGSGNSNTVVVQQVKSSIDLNGLQPRFRGGIVANRYWEHTRGTHHSDAIFPAIIQYADGITNNANFGSIRVDTVVGTKDYMMIGCDIYIRNVWGQDVQIASSKGVSNEVDYNNPYARAALSYPTGAMVNTFPIPSDGWSIIWGIFYFFQLRSFTTPPSIRVWTQFYDQKQAQRYQIVPDPSNVANVVVIGPNKMRNPSAIGSGLGITQSVTDGELIATVTYSVNNTFIPGNPAYTGSQSVPVGDIRVVYDFVSRSGDPENISDPLNSNKYPGQSFGSGSLPGNILTANSSPIPSGEYMQVRLTTTSLNGQDPSDTVTVNFQADSPSVTNIPSAFALTVNSNTQITASWTAVGGLYYRVELEEMTDGVDGNSPIRRVWTNFPTSSQFYSPNSAGVSGSAGSISFSGLHSGTTYQAIIRAVAPNSVISNAFDTSVVPQVPLAGAFARATTTGGLSDVVFNVTVMGSSAANLASKVPSNRIPAGAVGIVEDGADKGIYVYNPNSSPVWTKIAS